MDAKTFADEIVEPTIADFEREPRSPRRAFLACVATFHMIDYIAHPATPSQRRGAFRRQSQAFAVVDRVAHAFKHVATGHPSDQTLQPLTSDQVIERPPAFWGVAVWGLSRWDDAIGGVTIHGEHGHDLLEDVKEAAAFLRSKLPS
jgi:hypothetical protein